ncbi:glycosyltransferase family 1 protein [Xylariales sp. AK1849]|nr:glycosyltransferase family 1 protein [Xylariales sp. AK1849]
MSSPKRVLLLTNSEYGQASVHVATGHALLELYGDDVEVHLASFQPIEKIVKAASELAKQICPQAKPIVLHKVKGLDMMAAWSRPEIRLEEYNGLRPSFWNTPKFLKLLLLTTSPWNGPEFLEIYDSVAQILETVNPDVIAVDPAFSPALTACNHLGVNFVVLAPNTIKDFSMAFQAGGQALWKYPALASALPYPIPWNLIPLNIYFVLYIIAYMVFFDPTKKLEKYIRAQTGAQLLTLGHLNRAPPPGVKYLVANRPELEFPIRTPEHIIPCGPIVRPSAATADVDPELATWLTNGPTVYINLGTQVQTTEWDALEIARALKQLFSRASSHKDPRMRDLQVLWKLTKRGNYTANEPGARVHGILGEEIDNDKVRILSWLVPEPAAVLEEDNIVCSVHHGGANSFLEAANAGVPHVILPVWIDCFDFANRAELLGIGLWGNRSTVPMNSSSDLAPALIEVVLGERADSMRNRAKDLAEICKQEGGGRYVAARTIFEEIET